MTTHHIHKDPGRRKPPQDVKIALGTPTIIFLTVCTKDREPWLACDEAHKILRTIWEQAQAWLVGNYLLMPDHLHLFAAAHDLHFTAQTWITYWKSQFSKQHAHLDWRWQSSVFHHRLRDSESYTEKWNYVRQNPVRAGLANTADAWPYQGMIHPLRW